MARTRLPEKLRNIFFPALEIRSLPFQVVYLLLLDFLFFLIFINSVFQCENMKKTKELLDLSLLIA